MGKRLPSPTNLQRYTRAAAARIARPAAPLASSKDPTAPSTARAMDAAERHSGTSRAPAAAGRIPLSEVVSDCVQRWFQDTLKEAKAGDSAMQVLVGQMYQSGYGVVRNEQKAKTWLTKASRCRSSVWKVSEKRPGYNASDSDSDEVVKDDMK